MHKHQNTEIVEVDIHMKESRTENEAQTCKTNPTSFGKSMILKEGLERIHVRR